MSPLNDSPTLSYFCLSLDFLRVLGQNYLQSGSDLLLLDVCENNRFPHSRRTLFLPEEEGEFP